MRLVNLEMRPVRPENENSLEGVWEAELPHLPLYSSHIHCPAGEEITKQWEEITKQWEEITNSGRRLPTVGGDYQIAGRGRL